MSSCLQEKLWKFLRESFTNFSKKYYKVSPDVSLVILLKVAPKVFMRVRLEFTPNSSSRHPLTTLFAIPLISYSIILSVFFLISSVNLEISPIDLLGIVSVIHIVYMEISLRV